jgi:hypothetical protein
MNSIAKFTVDRAVEAFRLTLDPQNRTQWLPAATFRSVFCIAIVSVSAEWTIEAQLPTGDVVQVGAYDEGNLFAVGAPRYITTNAMCGLPIRFVSSQPQPNNNLWVVFKS